MANSRETSQYREEMRRVASFSSWPGKAEVCPLTLARTGFCYSGTNYVVFCWGCGKEIDADLYGNNVRHRHRIVAPNCPCLKNEDSGNVPLKLPTDFNIQVRNATETDHGKQCMDLSSMYENICQRASRRGIFEQNILKLNRSDPDYDVFRREIVRLASFQDWPVINCAVPDALAHAGFFYTGKTDVVCCSFCRKFCDQWKQEDIPWTAHQRLSPDCAFVRNELSICANVPKEDDILDQKVQLIGVSAISLQTDGQAAEEPSSNRTLEMQTFHSGTLSECAQRPKHLDMIEEEVRRLSFYKPNSVIPKGQEPTILAKAGFYYYGPSDYCKCFFCDGGLKNWQEDDEPWSEHARWYPRCEYVKSKKGSSFILMTQNAKSSHLQKMQPRFAGKTVATLGSELTASASPSLSSSENDNVVPKQCANSQGPSSGNRALTTVKAEVSSTQLQKQPSKSKSKNKKKKKKASQSKIGSQPGSDNQRMMPLEETETLEVEEETEANPDDSVEMLDDMERSLLEENRLLKEARTCKVCMENDVNIVFLPCGHLVCCQDCAPELRICAICRALIRGTVKTFLA